MLFKQQYPILFALGFLSVTFFSCDNLLHKTTQKLSSSSIGPVPLLRAHAHNDYNHERPLFDALDHGFTNIEVDIHLVDSKLLVAHDKEDVQIDRTLQSLYLNPLREHVRKNAGRIYSFGPQVTLLIDIKSDAESTYVTLQNVLAYYGDILTTFGPNSLNEGAVVAIISGNRSLEMMKRQTVCYAGYDGRLEDLESDESATLIPLISEKWSSLFTWEGDSLMPLDQAQKLNDFVQKAHLKGRRVRFWGTLDDSSQARYEVWRKLISADVDLINTDNLKGLQQFLIEHDPLVFTWCKTILWQKSVYLIFLQFIKIQSVSFLL